MADLADGVPAARTFAGAQGLRAAVGTHLGFSSWHTVTQQQVDQFAEATRDQQWIHVDPVKAAAGPFGATVAHGFLTLSMAPHLVSEVYRVDDVTMGVNYGAGRIRFPAPVPVGARIRAGVELTSLEAVPNGDLARLRITIQLEGSVKPACVAELLSLLA